VRGSKEKVDVVAMNQSFEGRTGRVTLAVGLWIVALFVALSLVCGLFGPAGESLSDAVSGLFGLASWAVVTVFIFAGVTALRGRLTAFRAGGDVVLVLVAATLTHLISADSGGVAGSFLGESAAAGLSVPGAFVMLISTMGLVLAERVRLKGLKAARAIVVSPVNSLHSVSSLHSVRSVRSVQHEQHEEHEEHEVFDGEDKSEDEGESDDEENEHDKEVAVPSRPQLTLVKTSSTSSTFSSRTGKFVLPSSRLLVRGESAASCVSEKDLHEEGALLASTLGAYDVKASVEEIATGPVVTTFETRIAAGTKLSKVMGLADDLSLAFGRKVRVVPSRLGRVGFEVANEKRACVALRELIESDSFRAASSKMALPVVLGRDVRGEGVFADLADMPHVIAAGATGAGKSVGLNVMLASLLYCRTPEELRFVMIDPKVVELQPYARIPHMLLPVVTDMKQAVDALTWAVNEMERRYQLLASAGAKNIVTFNAKAARGSRLPYIVIVVDEFADLIASQGKAVEALVSRLAQKARAAGMHMILATQRPSVDVITGTIKANFPTRIAFRVSQKVDSRVVLDEQGAEQLTGRGDSLVKLNGADAAVRVQCPMITEAEIESVTSYLCSQGAPAYDDSILSSVNDADGVDGGVKPVKAARKDAAVKVWS
jgi:DNA segregation ATPase FtsK/SpoIIIE-like protein